MSASDSKLIAKIIANGDPEAFEVLLKAHHNQVRVLLLRLSNGDIALADDLAQEVFLSAYSNIAQYRAKGTFSAWIYSIAYHAFLRYKSHNNAREEREKAWQVIQQNQNSNIEINIDLERAFVKLKPEECSAITLCFTLGHTNEEAATIMKIPTGTLKSHIHRGKSKLAAELKHYTRNGS